MSNYFTGKTVWLVGASEGIGAALASELAKETSHIILSARNEEKLKKLADSFVSRNASVLKLDVTDITSVQAAWEWMVAHSHVPDIFIYNAGTYVPMNTTQFDLGKVQQMLDVNLHGALRVLSLVLPVFLSRNSGHIALVASVAGYRGLPGAIGYGASKAALIHLAENLKADLAATHIKVQVINPGFVETRLTALNDFPMPCIISPQKAAKCIMQGLSQDRFEIHFPRRFSWILKCLSVLPYSLYFSLLSARVRKNNTSIKQK